MQNGSAITWLGSLALATALTSCNYQIVEFETPIATRPATETLPLTIGVYYPTSFSSYECIVSEGYIAAQWIVQPGPASIEIFDHVISGQFRKIVHVHGRSLSTKESKIAGVIELEITEYTGCDAAWPIFGSSVSIEYLATLWDSSGEKIAEWTGHGSAGPAEVEPLYNEAEYLRRLTSISMREAAANFVVAFEENDQITEWLKRNGIFHR